MVIPTKQRRCTATAVLVLAHILALLPYARARTRGMYIPGTKYEVRGCCCPEFVSWESYAERYEYLPDSQLIVDMSQDDE